MVEENSLEKTLTDLDAQLLADKERSAKLHREQEEKREKFRNVFDQVWSNTIMHTLQKITPLVSSKNFSIEDYNRTTNASSHQARMRKGVILRHNTSPSDYVAVLFKGDEYRSDIVISISKDGNRERDEDVKYSPSDITPQLIENKIVEALKKFKSK